MPELSIQGGTTASATDAARRALRPAVALAETYSRSDGYQQNASVLTGGQLWLNAIYLPTGITVTNIVFATGATAANGPTHWAYALYDGSRNLKASSADQTTTAMAANTVLSLAMGTPYPVTSGGLYYIGMWATATVTLPTIVGRVDVGSANHATAPILSGSSTGSLTTTAPDPAGAITAVTANNVLMYGYVS